MVNMQMLLGEMIHEDNLKNCFGTAMVSNNGQKVQFLVITVS